MCTCLSLQEQLTFFIFDFFRYLRAWVQCGIKVFDLKTLLYAYVHGQLAPARLATHSLRLVRTCFVLVLTLGE